MKNIKGFTLIELLASITIILILFVVIVPMSTGLIEKSNKDQCNKLSDIFKAAAELCNLDKLEACSEGHDVPLNDLYLNGYIEEKYENKYTNEILTKGDDKFRGYKVRIAKQITSGDKGYLTYELLDNSGNNPCE